MMNKPQTAPTVAGTCDRCGSPFEYKKYPGIHVEFRYCKKCKAEFAANGIKTCRHQYWDLDRCIDCSKTADEVEKLRLQTAHAMDFMFTPRGFYRLDILALQWESFAGSVFVNEDRRTAYGMAARELRRVMAEECADKDDA